MPVRDVQPDAVLRIAGHAMNQQLNGDAGLSQTPCTCGPNMRMQGCHGHNCPHYSGYQGINANVSQHSKDWEDGYAAGYSAALAAMRQQGPHHQWQGQLGVAQVNSTQLCQSQI